MEYRNRPCGPRTTKSNKAYTKQELINLALNLNVVKNKSTASKSSKDELCELIINTDDYYNVSRDIENIANSLNLNIKNKSVKDVCVFIYLDKVMKKHQHKINMKELKEVRAAEAADESYYENLKKEKKQKELQEKAMKEKQDKISRIQKLAIGFNSEKSLKILEYGDELVKEAIGESGYDEVKKVADAYSSRAANKSVTDADLYTIDEFYNKLNEENALQPSPEELKLISDFLEEDIIRFSTRKHRFDFINNNNLNHLANYIEKINDSIVNINSIYDLHQLEKNINTDYLLIQDELFLSKEDLQTITEKCPNLKILQIFMRKGLDMDIPIMFSTEVIDLSELPKTCEHFLTNCKVTGKSKVLKGLSVFNPTEFTYDMVPTPTDIPNLKIFKVFNNYGTTTIKSLPSYDLDKIMIKSNKLIDLKKTYPKASLADCIVDT